MKPVTITLSEDELAIIRGWYTAAVGESAAERNDETFVLLEKLGVEAEYHHIWAPNPEYSIPSTRPAVEAEVAAVMAYRKRHPDYASVREVEAEQPEGKSAV